MILLNVKIFITDCIPKMDKHVRFLDATLICLGTFTKFICEKYTRGEKNVLYIYIRVFRCAKHRVLDNVPG